MPSAAAGFFPVVFLTGLASVAGRSFQKGCDVGALTETLKAREISGQELLNICKDDYSEVVCHAAGVSLSQSLSAELRRGEVPLPRLATLACQAIEATAAQQRTLLLRQGRSGSASSVSANLAAEDAESVREDAAAHKLSRKVAEHYRSNEDYIARSSTAQQVSLSLNYALFRASIPIPHGDFHWEKTTKNASKIEKAVHDWQEKQIKELNVSSPEVEARNAAFTKYATTSTKPPATTKPAKKAAKKKAKLTEVSASTPERKVGKQAGLPEVQATRESSSAVVSPGSTVPMPSLPRKSPRDSAKVRLPARAATSELDEIVDEVMGARASSKAVA